MSSNYVHEFISWDLFEGISLIDCACFFAVYVCLCMLPIGSMYGISSYIYHTNQTNPRVILHAREDQFISNLFGKSFAILDVWISYPIYIYVYTWIIDTDIPAPLNVIM